MAVALPTPDIAAIETYAGLQAYVADTLDRDDLDAKIPTFVRLAEYQLRRDILNPARELVHLLTTTAGTTTVALPSGFTQMRSLSIIADIPFPPLSHVALTTVRGEFNYQGQPCVYTIHGGNIILGPTPDAVYNLSLAYMADITPLSNGSPSNWLLDNHADIYFYATMLQADAYVQDDERLGIWKAGLEQAIVSLNRAGNRYRGSGNPVRLRSPVVV